MIQTTYDCIVRECISEMQNIKRFPLDFPSLLSASNPFRFFSNMTMTQIVDSILERHKEKSEHTILGDLLERIAIKINFLVDGGRKSKEVDVDLEISEKNTFYGIKNSPKWGNANQRRAVSQTYEMMRENRKNFAVLCLYGHSLVRRKDSFPQFGGQESWYQITRDEESYQKVWLGINNNENEYRQFIESIYIFDRNRSVEWMIENFSKENKR